MLAAMSESLAFLVRGRLGRCSRSHDVHSSWSAPGSGVGMREEDHR